MYPYNLLKNSVVILIKGKPHNIESTHPNYAYVRDAIKTRTWEGIEELVNIPAAIVRASQGLVQVLDGTVTYKGRPVHSHLASRILELMTQGFGISPWAKFMDKLHSNPDTFSIEQLYPFLERAKLPITPDGDFLAYKYVNNNYFDCHTNTMDNSPGKTVELKRELCDNNPNNHCSAGLHFCAKEYLQSGGGYRTVIVKVNPKDVVSVPNDHNFQKARACRYVVVGELNEDYSIEDMEAKAILPEPRNVKEINKPAGVKMGARLLKVFMYKNSRKAPISLSNQRVGVKKAFKKEGL